MVWPTLQQYTDDAYALDFLAEILSSGKKAPLYKVLVKEKDLTATELSQGFIQRAERLFLLGLIIGVSSGLEIPWPIGELNVPS